MTLSTETNEETTQLRVKKASAGYVILQPEESPGFFFCDSAVPYFQAAPFTCAWGPSPPLIPPSLLGVCVALVAVGGSMCTE